MAVFEPHPAAALFPMLDVDDLDALAADIRENGLLEPVWLTPDGLVLDGRNRLAACEIAGIEPEFRTFTGDDPVGFVMSANLHRRHLTAGQRAMLAVELLPLYEAEAKLRQAEAGTKGAPGRPAKKGVADLPEVSPLSRDRAASAAGVSGRAVAQAKRVVREAPDLAEKVATGELTLDNAEKQTKRRRAETEEQKARAVQMSAVTPDATGNGWKLWHGDFRDRLDEIPDGSVDLIVTDPPYPSEFLPLYSDLSKHAARVLRPQGIAVVLTGQIHIDKVIGRLGEELSYGWMYCQPLPGSNSRIMARHVLQSWKPWLAFSNGAWPSGRVDWHPDVLDPSARGKDQYRWQQDPNPAAMLITELCPEGGTVLDPFMGTGAYGLVTLKLGRLFIGIEADSDRFTATTERFE